jgi:hypothetical protein
MFPPSRPSRGNEERLIPWSGRVRVARSTGLLRTAVPLIEAAEGWSGRASLHRQTDVPPFQHHREDRPTAHERTEVAQVYRGGQIYRWNGVATYGSRIQSLGSFTKMPLPWWRQMTRNASSRTKTCLIVDGLTS